MRKIIIQDSVFELYPEFCRQLIIVRDISNNSENNVIQELLEAQLSNAGSTDSEVDSRLEAWDLAHRGFGSNPNKYPPSIKSLVKRIRKNPNIPFINSVVALFNYISIKYALPCGGDDLTAIEGNLVLGISDGTESFRALGASKTETPKPGEVVYLDDATKNVMCRRWNWRNGDDTKIVESSKQIVINLDCLPPITPEIGVAARDELAELLISNCSAVLDTGKLSASNREYSL